MRGAEAKPMREVLEELRQTACLLAGSHELTVVEGEDRAGWSYNSTTKVISMDSTRLRTETIDFNRGLLLHEATHCAITRLRPLIQGDLYARPEVFSIINAVEDCRIESWLIERFPGSKPWIKEYNDKLIRSSFKGRVDQSEADFPAILAMPWLIVSTWWHGKHALDSIPPEWSAIRDEIWPTVDAISRLYPRAIIPSHEVKTRYEELGLPIRFLGDDSEQEPNVWERETRLCQAEMWYLFEKSISPVLRRLLPDSKKPRLREWYRQWLTVWLGNHWGDRNASRRSNGQYLSGQQGTNSDGSGTESSNIPWKANLPAYETIRSRNASVIGRLSDEILRRLQPEVHRCWSGPFTSGTNLCLRSVVRAAGDQSLKEQIWRRQTHNTLPDPLIVLLIDHSGSMEGQRMHVTTEAAVILSETCARCGIGLSVFAFESDCVPVVDWKQPIDDTARSILGGLADAAEGGTDLELALNSMLRHFAESRHFATRYLFVLSDGNVEEVVKIRAAVQKLELEGIQVRGLGLGPETRNLKEVIPNSEVELATLQVPKAIIQLLLKTIPSREPSRI